MTADAGNSNASPFEPQPVTEEERQRLGLLPGWTFYDARTDLACWLCGQPAMFYVPGEGRVMGFCLRHARDF